MKQEEEKIIDLEIISYYLNKFLWAIKSCIDNGYDSITGVLVKLKQRPTTSQQIFMFYFGFVFMIFYYSLYLLYLEYIYRKQKNKVIKVKDS